MKHTPTPWNTGRNFSGELGIWDKLDRAILHSGKDDIACAEREANAAFIVQACNAHEELLGALKTAIEVMEDNEIDTMLASEFDVLFRDVIEEATK